MPSGRDVMRGSSGIGLAAGLGILAWAGCGGGGASIRDERPDWPRGDPVSDDQMLVGVGESCEGRTAAEMAARAQVAGQVESSLRKVVEVVIESGDRGEWERVLSRNREEIRFGHGEWIAVRRVDGPDRRGCHRAVAVLDRGDGVRLLGEEYRGQSAAFRAEAARAKAHREDLEGFAPPFREAQRHFSELARQAMRIAAVDPRHGLPAEFQEDQATWEDLMGIQQGLLGSLRVVVVPDRMDPLEVQEAVLGTVQGALARLGLVARVAGTCDGDLGVFVRAAMGCRWGSLGWNCQVQGRIALRGCRKADLPRGEFDLGTLGRGGHPSQEDVARRGSLQRMTPEAVEKAIRAAVGEVLPLR